MSTLLEPHKDSKPTEKDMEMLRGDSQLIIVAGRLIPLFQILDSIQVNLKLTLPSTVTQSPHLLPAYFIDLPATLSTFLNCARR